ncbi:MAG: hypothetical protein JNL70_18265 [Saprospiraceae bacterium]|nr:hypothetical protein [Saprospiraceae bacterium]
MKLRTVFKLLTIGLLTISIVLNYNCQTRSKNRATESNDSMGNMPKILEFTLIEAKSNEPMRNQEIDINYYQMAYDVPPILDFIKKLKTDSEGKFMLLTNIFGNKEIGIKCGENYHLITFGIKNGLIFFFRLKNGFGQTISKTFYNLETGTETNYVLYKDSTVSKIKDIKLFAYDVKSYYLEFKEKVIERKVEFNADQRKLWTFMWSEFEKNYSGETTPPFNSHFWYSVITASKKVFHLDTKTLYGLTQNVKDKNKQYYFSFCDNFCGILVNGYYSI